MQRYQLAQLNIAAMKAPLDSPPMADFVADLDRINTLADASAGFVWRLQDEDGDATALHPFGENFVVNMSVWWDIESLHAFAFRSGHVEVLRRRRDWFTPQTEAYAVLWWVPQGHLPTMAEAAERLAHLKEFGPTAYAFTFKEPFASPAAEGQRGRVAFDDECPTA